MPVNVNVNEPAPEPESVQGPKSKVQGLKFKSEENTFVIARSNEVGEGDEAI